MVAAEAAAAGLPALVARHSGLAEVAAGLEAELPPALGRLVSVPDGDAAGRSRERLRGALRAAARPIARALRAAVAARSQRQRWSWAGIARRGCSSSSADRASASRDRMASDASARDGRLAARREPYDQLRRRDRRATRERSRRRTDFTVAVEEEFALLDPETLDLVNRFEDVQAAARGTALEPNLVGELIASEVEVKTGRCRRRSRTSRPRSPSGAPQLARARRAARPRARRDGHAPVGELAGPADHRHAALPAQRRDPPLRRLAEQHLRPPRPRRDPRRRPRDRGSRRRSATGSRSCSRSRRARRSSRASTPGSTRRGRRSSRASSRAAACPTRSRSGTSTSRLRPLPLRDGLDRRAHAALVERPPAPRVPDRRDPHLRRPAGPRRGAVARRAHASSLTARCARALDEGEPLPEHPHRLIEENIWRAIRYGLSGELIDLERGDVRPGARAARAADRVGAAGRRGDRRGAVAPRFPSGTRPSGRSRGARRARRSRRSTPSRCA